MSSSVFATRGCNKKKGEKERETWRRRVDARNVAKHELVGLDLKSHGALLRRQSKTVVRQTSPPRLYSLLPVSKLGGKKCATSSVRKAGAKGRETMRLIDDDRSSCSEFRGNGLMCKRKERKRRDTREKRERFPRRGLRASSFAENPLN